jgi:3-dehydroquinate dehydratase-2
MKILVLHGPNLNLLGLREPGIYGSATLSEIDEDIRSLAQELGVGVDIEQSNIEGALVYAIQEAPSKGYEGIIINPAAFGHTSIALRDALLAINLPFIEVHLSNTFARESFRHTSYLSDIAAGIIIGMGPAGYLLAFRALAQMLSVSLAMKSTSDEATATP